MVLKLSTLAHKWSDIAWQCFFSVTFGFLRELAGGGSVDVAVGVSDMGQVTGNRCHATHDT